MGHDDEGYVLISLKNYSEHGGLYSRVFSQYGPFLYLFHDVGHRIFGYQFTNTTGRLVTLVCWMVTVSAMAHLVWQQTKAFTLTYFSFALTFFHLWLMIGEPIHPGGLITALVAVGAWGGAQLIERSAIRSLAVTAGLLGAALLLIKINVGGFFLISAGVWFATQLKNVRHGRIAVLFLAAFLATLPFGLMFTELKGEWAQVFAILSAIASLTMLSVAWRERQSLTTWSHATYGSSALVGLGLIVVIAVCFRGTTFFEMVNGVLLSPLRQPGVYHYPPFWRPGKEVFGALSVLLAVLVMIGHVTRLAWFLIGVRIILAIGIALASVEWLPFTSHSSIMSYGVPFAWIFAIRLAAKGTESRPNPATWVGLLLVLQYLHAYPVAGSQIAWGTFLFIPLLALGLNDTQNFILEHKIPRLATALGVSCFVLATISSVHLSLIGWHRYTESHPLGLMGAEDVRPPEDLASTLRILTLNATAHGDMLFSLPGMFSFNGWTQLPAPTFANTTHWFSLLTSKQQEEIATSLAHSKRPVLILHRGLLQFLTDSKFVVSSSLRDYLDQNFARVFTLGKYEFWSRRGQKIVPIATAEFQQLKTPQAGLAADKLELVVMIPTGRKIARIELTTLQEKPRILSSWNETTGPLLVTGINLRGEAITPETNSGWNQPLPPLARLNLPVEKPVLPQRKTSVVYLRDEQGAVLAEARFIE